MSQPFNVPRPFQRLLMACAAVGVLASAQAASSGSPLRQPVSAGRVQLSTQ